MEKFEWKIDWNTKISATTQTSNTLHSKTSSHQSSTESCPAAATRFIARRGYPNWIISDNATNFARAANKMRAFKNEWDKAMIESDLAQKKIAWKFNPRGALHFGGIFERLVQCCKKVIIAILDNRSLTDEIRSATMALLKQSPWQQ